MRIGLFFAVGALVCGFVGNCLVLPLDPAKPLPWLLDTLRRTLSLFFGGNSSDASPTPLIALARLFGLMATMSIVLDLIWLRLRGVLFRLITPFRSGHVVIIGSSPVGLQIAASVMKRDKALVMVSDGSMDTSTRDDLLRRATLFEAPHIAQEEVLARLALSRAGAVYVCPRIEAASQAAMQWMARSGNLPQQVAVTSSCHGRLLHIAADELSGLGVAVTPFTSEGIAARHVLQEFAPSAIARLLGLPKVHAVIVGSGGLVSALVNDLVRVALHPHLGRPTVTVITTDPDTSTEMERVGRLLDGLATIRLAPADMARRIPDWDMVLDWILAGQTPVSTVYFASSQAGENIERALLLRRNLRSTGKWQAPSFIAVHDTPISDVLFSRFAQTRRIADVIHPFAQSDKLLAEESIFPPKRDALAKAFHEYFRSRYPSTTGPNSKHWENLPLTYREANRGLADHLSVKLNAIGYRQVTAQGHPVPQPASDAVVSALAKLEHDRWMVDRFMDGWRFGPRREDDRFIHDCLVPWEQLPQGQRDKDRIFAGEIAEIIALLPDPITVAQERWIFLYPDGPSPDPVPDDVTGLAIMIVTPLADQDQLAALRSVVERLDSLALAELCVVIPRVESRPAGLEEEVATVLANRKVHEFQLSESCLDGAFHLDRYRRSILGLPMAEEAATS